MFELFLDSMKLFLRGKLFKDPGKVARQTALGAGTAAAVSLVLVFAGMSLWLAVGIASFGAGAFQPWLFKDLRYQ